MNNFICAENASGSGSIIMYVVLIVALVAMLIMPYFTQRKKNQEFMKMMDSMKVGDLVKTAGGIIGKITKITDKGDIKTVVLETGSKTEKSYMELDMSMIYCVLKSTKVEKSDDESSDKPEETETIEAQPEEKAEASTDPIVEVVENEVKPEVAKPKKKTSTKTAVKKSATKK